MPEPLPETGFRGLLNRLGKRMKQVATPSIEAVSQNIVVEARAFGMSALGVTTFVLVGIVGYVFAMLGIVWLLAGSLGMPAALFLIGGIHLVVGVIGTLVLVRVARTLDVKAALMGAEPTAPTAPATPVEPVEEIETSKSTQFMP